MTGRRFKPTPRLLRFAAAVAITLAMSILFDQAAFATFVFPVLWAIVGMPSRCRAPSRSP